MKEICALIPARSGSKGVLKKNLKKLNGHPLIAYSIRAAFSSKTIGRVIVSTNCEEIAYVARQYGAEIPFMRPVKYAKDTSEMVPMVLDLLETIKTKESYIPDYILLLQPTSPTRTEKDIDRAVDTLLSSNANAIVSVEQTENLLYTKDDKGYIKLISDKRHLISHNRQALPDTFRLDGSMIYCIKTKNWPGFYWKQKKPKKDSAS